MALPSQTITANNRTNCWVVGREGAVVIDPGTPYRRERQMLARTVEALREEGVAVEAVVLTHHHQDHTAAAGWLGRRFELPIWCHQTTAEQLEGVSSTSRFLRDGDSIDLGAGRSLKVWETPGHAAGHLAFELRPEGHMVVGDLVARGTTVLIDPSEGDMGRYLESLRRVRELSPRSLLPGHGDPIGDAAETIDWYLMHREEREQEILEALERVTRMTGGPVSPADLVPEVYDEAPRRRWPLAMRSLESHLIHLEKQGQAKRLGDKWLAGRSRQ